MTAGRLALYGYWRSSAAYRVRLALAWKGIDYDSIPIDLRVGAQSAPDYLARNPQGLVPLLVTADSALSQSVAIIEYLDELYPQPPLLPADPIGRAHVRAAAHIIACDIHPLNNLRVQRFLNGEMGLEAEKTAEWGRHWVGAGLAALEAFAAAHGGDFLYGDTLSMADICLVPQLYNARRIDIDIIGYQRLYRIEKAIQAEKIFASAHPDAQMNVA